jgi:hypothetical protein
MTTETADGLEIRELGDFQRVQLKPGDRLVLTCKGHVSMEMADRIKAYVDKWAPGVPVLVLDDNMRLGVVGAE